MRTAWSLAFCLAALALAGCAGQEEQQLPTPTPSPPAEGCDVQVHGLPAHVRPGSAFTFSVPLVCGFAWTSDHAGAHYGLRQTDEPSTTVYDKACEHQAADQDTGALTVRCTIADAGTYYLRGHLRITQDGEQTNFFSREYVVVAGEPAAGRGGVTLHLSDVPSTAQAGEYFRFGLDVAWPVATGATSDHIGAHFGPNAFPAGSTTDYPQACDHQQGAVPGTFEVQCKVASAGEIHLRGHARFTQEGNLVDHWSDDVKIVVE